MRDGCIYVIKWRRGGVKIGVTSCVTTRLEAYRTWAKNHDDEIENFWVSDRIYGMFKIEKSVIDHFRDKLIRGKETFDIDFHDAIEIVWDKMLH